MSSRPPLAAILLLVIATPAAADEGDPLGLDIDANAEYRVDSTYIDPFELGGDQVTRTMWTDQRLRTNVSVKRDETVELHVQADLLAGVLFGDTGTYGTGPSTNSGVALASKQPNTTAWEVGLGKGGDPLDPDAYVPVLRRADPVLVNHAYGDAFLPVGLLRVGRQPLSYGANLSSHEGTRINRWGMSRYADTVDRVMFATKLDELYLTLREGPAHEKNMSQTDGLFFAVFHDWLNQRSIFSVGDDTRQVGAALQLRRPELEVGGLVIEDLFLSAILIHLSDDGFGSTVWALPLKAEARTGPLAVSTQLMPIRGRSREVSEGFAALSNTDARSQKIRALGAQAIVDYDVGPLTATLEVDYASGDDDPRPQTPLTQFSFARDLNVGLLLFEQILAFESARSAAVGIENLAGVDADSFPLTEVATSGRFTNAIALFPQLGVRLVENDRHLLRSRTGVLFAWPAADGVVDPIMTILAEDGDEISDDAVNFHGGEPGSYYGTEIDQQLEWTFRDRFIWTIEGAVLLPGSSLENEHGQAVSAFLIDNRFTYLF
ncbi:MAG TPA: hypothetical protein VMZ28_01985 [Kofleriaceae bacterium]|nr:hypothetical protein [Kofleriaceae bacterium]